MRMLRKINELLESKILGDALQSGDVNSATVLENYAFFNSAKQTCLLWKKSRAE